MQIVLHDIVYSKPFSVLTSLVTACSYSHGSLMIDKKIYDTTMTRGYFDQAQDLHSRGGREVTIIDVPEIDSIESFLMLAIGKKYDTAGLLLWPFDYHSKNKWFCFEAVVECLRHYGIDINPDNRPIDGDKIFDYFSQHNYKIYRVRSMDVNYSWFK